METNTILDREYLWKDREYPADERPGKLELILKGKRGRLFCTYYMAGGAGTHPVVIICHGFPGNEKNLDLAAALRRVGFHVMSFHYSGSWGSDGNFSFRNCLEDTGTVFDYVMSDPELQADTDRVFLWGHSMGGFLAYHLMVRYSPAFRKARNQDLPEFRPAGAILAMPADFAAMMLETEKNSDMKAEALEFLGEGAGWLTGTSGELLYREAVGLGETQKMEHLLEYLPDVPMFFINGSEDEMIPAELALDGIVKKAEERGFSGVRRLDLQTDHMAADRRCALTEATADWLIEQCRF